MFSSQKSTKLKFLAFLFAFEPMTRFTVFLIKMPFFEQKNIKNVLRFCLPVVKR